MLTFELSSLASMPEYTSNLQITLWLPHEGLRKECSYIQTTWHPSFRPPGHLEDHHLKPVQRLRTQDWFFSRMYSLDGERFHHTTQNCVQPKIFISGIFNLIFLDHSWLWIAETAESKVVDKGGLLYWIASFMAWYLSIIESILM